MKSDPTVTVVIPTFNRAAIVTRAIDSVLGQTYGNTEIIVVDDGSTDNTAQTLRCYGDRIRVIRQKNAGPSVARNRGIAAARGTIIAFLDSDDQWLPTKLSRQVALLETLGDAAPCCLCNCTTVYSDGSRASTFQIADVLPDCPTGVWLNPTEVLTTRFVIFSQAVAIRKRVLDRIGCFDENLPFFCEDHDLALRLSLEGPWGVIRDELVVCRGAGPDSLGEQALRQEAQLYRDLVYLHAANVHRLSDGGHRPVLKRLALRELARARRQLIAARLANAGIIGGATLSAAMRSIERVRRALFRRTRCYPQVEVNAVTMPNRATSSAGR